MLRVGLTGELGSGKSLVAAMLAERGAVVMSSDEMAREMMQPGQPVYRAIVERFGPSVVLEDGTLHRAELARLAFDPEEPRVEELNAIVHPAVFAEQQRWIAELARSQPDAIVIVESALIFSAKLVDGEGSWRRRFDRIIVVTAPDEAKIERFLGRVAGNRLLSAEEADALRSDARRRLQRQRLPQDADGDALCVENSGSVADLKEKVGLLWEKLLTLRT